MRRRQEEPRKAVHVGYVVSGSSDPKVEIQLSGYANGAAISTSDTVVLMRDLARAYAQIHGCLPPAIRWADVGLRRGMNDEAREKTKRKAVEGHKAWRERKAKR